MPMAFKTNNLTQLLLASMVFSSILLSSVAYAFTTDIQEEPLANDISEYCIPKIRNDDRLIVLDDKGVPITDYGYLQGKYVGPMRYPITISNVALSYYSVVTNSNDVNLRAMRYFDALAASRGSESLYTFLANANWLKDNAKTYSNYSIFNHEFAVPYPPYAIHPPWRSGMAQGLAVDVLAKAYNLTKDMQYLDAAKKLLNAFYIDVRNGGVTYKTPDDGWWYEQYANDQGIEPRVLNGHMFALLGLHSHYTITNDSSAKSLFDNGVTALKHNLPRYDTGLNYSYYDASKKLSPLYYHRVVVEQLRNLYDITKEPILKTYYEKWHDLKVPEEIVRSTICKRSLAAPELIFKPADSNLRVGPTDTNPPNYNYTLDGSLIGSSYHREFHSWNASALNFTSQFINFRANNITIDVPDKTLDKISQLVFTFNVEGIRQRDYDVNVVFGSSSVNVADGWDKSHKRYTLNAGEENSIVINPLHLIGNDYLRVKNADLYVSGSKLFDNIEFRINLL
jgi:hypothetical protein